MPLQQETLFRVQLEACCTDPLKDLSQRLEGSIKVQPMCQHIIQLHRQRSGSMPASTFLISRSNIAGALHSPNGMVLNCHSPFPVVKAVLALSTGAMATCQ